MGPIASFRTAVATTADLALNNMGIRNDLLPLKVALAKIATFSRAEDRVAAAFALASKLISGPGLYDSSPVNLTPSEIIRRRARGEPISCRHATQLLGLALQYVQLSPRAQRTGMLDEDSFIFEIQNQNGHSWIDIMIPFQGANGWSFKTFSLDLYLNPTVYLPLNPRGQASSTSGEEPRELRVPQDSFVSQKSDPNGATHLVIGRV